MNKIVFGLLAFAAATASASAQDVQSTLTELLDDWRSQHGDSWYVHASDTTGRFEMLYGGFWIVERQEHLAKGDPGDRQIGAEPHRCQEGSLRFRQFPQLDHRNPIPKMDSGIGGIQV